MSKNPYEGGLYRDEFTGELKQHPFSWYWNIFKREVFLDLMVGVVIVVPFMLLYLVYKFVRLFT